MKALVTDEWVMRYVSELKAEFPAVEFVRDASAEIEVVIGHVDDELLRTVRQVKWIQALSAGVEWLREVSTLAESEVVVTNARGAHAATIAEHAFGMLVFSRDASMPSTARSRSGSGCSRRPRAPWAFPA